MNLTVYSFWWQNNAERSYSNLAAQFWWNRFQAQKELQKQQKRKLLIPGLEQEINKRNLKHLIVSKSKTVMEDSCQ